MPVAASNELFLRYCGEIKRRFNKVSLLIVTDALLAAPSVEGSIVHLPQLLLLIFSIAANPNTELAMLKAVLKMLEPVVVANDKHASGGLAAVVEGAVFQQLIGHVQQSSEGEAPPAMLLHVFAWLLPQLSSAQQAELVAEVPLWFQNISSGSCLASSNGMAKVLESASTNSATALLIRPHLETMLRALDNSSQRSTVCHCLRFTVRVCRVWTFAPCLVVYV